MSDLSMNVAGIDTSKRQLVVHFLPEGLSFSVANSKAGIAELARRCVKAGRRRAVLEATSIYHEACARALFKAGLEVIVAQPRQVRDFAKALLKWSKSDAVDAAVLARFAQIASPPAPLRAEALDKLAEHLAFIEHLEGQIVALKTFAERLAGQRLVKLNATERQRLERRLRAELKRLEVALRQDQAMAHRLELLLSIPGVGLRTALSCLILMPELGALTREQAAALAGLAPREHESGTLKGKAHIHGGRARLRKTLYMAAFAGAMRWNPQLGAFYKKRMAAGMAHTAAVVACARKLIIIANAVLTRQTPWVEREVMP